LVSPVVEVFLETGASSAYIDTVTYCV